MKEKETPQRQAILKILEGNRAHPAAADVYIKLRRKFPNVSFATVYNNLEKLVSCGRLAELTIDPGKKRFDPRLAPHDHVLCPACGGIFDRNKGKKKITVKGFRVISFTTQIKALCPICLKKERKRTKKGGARR